MHRPFIRLALAFTGALAVAAPQIEAQVVEQTIQIAPGGGVGGIQLPMGMGGPRQNKTGTGRIRGRVVASDGSGPVRRAQVRLTSQDITPKVALTDAEGRFEFRELPASRFTMQASKSGFMTVQYGQSRPFESGKPIELADRQAMDNADIAVPRGGVISGRVVDEFGDALPDVQVTAMRQAWANGRRRLMPSPGRIATTNDLGQFRIYGLPPGEYYVSASMRGSAVEMFDMEVMMIGAASAGAATPTASTPKSGYASTYYPGTVNPAEAQRVTLASGQEATGADFPLIAVRLSRVTGVVLNSDGKPAEGALVSLVSASRDLGLSLNLPSARTARNGTFVVNNVPPGDYTLQVRGIQIITSTQGDNTMVFRAASMVGGGEAEFGSTPVSVSGEDVENVMLTTSKGGTATGRVTFDGPMPAAATAVRIMSTAVDPENALGGVGGAAGAVKEDGSFELKGLAGPRMIRVAAPPGWTLKSVKLNGIDITDTGADFKPGETTSGLEVELTSKPTTVSGGVTETGGAALKDYTVVVFSETPDHWRLPMTRWVQGARPDQDGRFKMQNLPPGSYYAVAVDYLPQGEWGDPEILERLKSRATRFSLDEGGTQSLDLKLTGQY